MLSSPSQILWEGHAGLKNYSSISMNYSLLRTWACWSTLITYRFPPFRSLLPLISFVPISILLLPSAKGLFISLEGFHWQFFIQWFPVSFFFFYYRLERFSTTNPISRLRRAQRLAADDDIRDVSSQNHPFMIWYYDSLLLFCLYSLQLSWDYIQMTMRILIAESKFITVLQLLLSDS